MTSKREGVERVSVAAAPMDPMRLACSWCGVLAKQPCVDTGMGRWIGGVHFDRAFGAQECDHRNALSALATKARGARIAAHIAPVAEEQLPPIEDTYGLGAVPVADALRQRESQLRRALGEIGKLKAYLNTPETNDFFAGIQAEAAHQRFRWPSENDAGKTPADWFWLIGYLAGKCLYAAIAGDTDKALHHTISTAAALANWHRAIKGVGNMRPGIDTPAEATPD